MSIQDVKNRRTQLKDLRDSLAREEAKTGSGAAPAMPKQELFNARDVEEKHPDKRLRWVNLRNPDRAISRVASGYVRLPESDGGKHIGDEYALFYIPKQEYERRVADINRKTRERLEAHNTEFQNLVESVARELRDKHGIRVTAEQLMKE